jgi:hypothetical protein
MLTLGGQCVKNAVQFGIWVAAQRLLYDRVKPRKP